MLKSNKFLNSVKREIHNNCFKIMYLFETFMGEKKDLLIIIYLDLGPENFKFYEGIRLRNMAREVKVRNLGYRIRGMVSRFDGQDEF